MKKIGTLELVIMREYRNLTRESKSTLIKFERNSFTIVLLSLLILFAASLATTLPLPTAHSDSLTGGALTQRIGIYDVELKTAPANPIAGEKTDIVVRIGNINGEDVIDTPITISVTNKHGEEVHRTNTIFVPSGHYTYPFNFPETGIYGIDIMIHDLAPIGEAESSPPSQLQGLLFTFPISIQSKSLLGFGLHSVLIITIFAACATILYSLKRKRKTSYQPNGMS